MFKFYLFHLALIRVFFVSVFVFVCLFVCLLLFVSLFCCLFCLVFVADGYGAYNIPWRLQGQRAIGSSDGRHARPVSEPGWNCRFSWKWRNSSTARIGGEINLSGRAGPTGLHRLHLFRHLYFCAERDASLPACSFVFHRCHSYAYLAVCLCCRHNCIIVWLFTDCKKNKK